MAGAVLSCLRDGQTKIKGLKISHISQKNHELQFIHQAGRQLQNTQIKY